MPSETRVSQNGVFRQVGYRPHEQQKVIHKAKRDHRFRVVSAGRRFGKSQVGGHELTTAAHIAYAMRGSLEPKGHRHEYWIVGPEYSDSEKEFRVLYNDITKLGMPMDKPGTYYSEDATNMRMSLFGGRFIVSGMSAKYPDTLVGEGLHGVVMAEAAKLKEVVWTKYIRPTLADYARENPASWALFSTTPEGKNWLYRQYMRGQDATDLSWWSMRAPSWSNTVLFPGGRTDPEIIEMEHDMSPEKFKQEVGAEFTEFVGRVFKDFSEETHVGNYPYDPRWPVYVAMDKGFRAPSVVLFVQVDVFDNVWVCGEYYKPGRDAEEVAADVWDDPKLGPMVRSALMGFPDPASPEWAATMEKKWSLRMASGTGGELSVRLGLIRKWLRPQPFELEDGHPEKLPKLHFDYSCTESIREFNDYRYPETREEAKTDPTENPMKKDDHTPEALGRFYKGHFGKQEEAHESARVSQARMGRRR